MTAPKPSEDPDDGADVVELGTGGRRRKREPGGRPHQRTVRLSDIELAILQTAATRAGVDVATFIAGAALMAAATATAAPDVLAADVTQDDADGGHPQSAVAIGDVPLGDDMAELTPAEIAAIAGGHDMSATSPPPPPVLAVGAPRRQPRRQPRRRRKRR